MESGQNEENVSRADGAQGLRELRQAVYLASLSADALLWSGSEWRMQPVVMLCVTSLGS